MAERNVRQKQLKKLKSFIDKTEKQLDLILGSLKWSKEKTIGKVFYNAVS